MSSDQEPESLDSWDINGLNSLDLWDYSMELECLRGPQGKKYFPLKMPIKNKTFSSHRTIFY